MEHLIKSQLYRVEAKKSEGIAPQANMLTPFQG